MRYLNKNAIELFLDAGTALSAFASAAFWFWSAWGDLPQMGNYWGTTPKDDPFFQALLSSAQMNRDAAFFSGFSAGLFGIRIIFSRFC